MKMSIIVKNKKNGKMERGVAQMTTKYVNIFQEEKEKQTVIKLQTNKTWM